jgi:hypothetical protein
MNAEYRIVSQQGRPGHVSITYGDSSAASVATGDARLIVRVAGGLARRIEQACEITGTQDFEAVPAAGEGVCFGRLSEYGDAKYKNNKYQQSDDGSIVD